MSAVEVTCTTCDADATVTLGALSYCSPCREVIRDEIRARVIGDESGIGWAVLAGRHRPDFGAGAVDAECSRCGATWVADVLGESCGWCESSVDKLMIWQAEIVLKPPEVDVDDRRRDDAIRGWADRLAVAVEAGTITEHHARQAWDREVVADVAA